MQLILFESCEFLAVESVTVHPDIAQIENGVGFINDVVIVKLVEPSTITPVAIAAPGVVLNNEIVTEIGWGLQLPILNSEIGQTTLREVDTKVIGNEECVNGMKNFFSPVQEANFVLGDSDLCT